jgi:hypothetical protein
VLADIPKVDGRDAAQAVQAAARRAGVGGAGILDSSQFASLHPGYWVVFAGRYASESEARATLGMARRVSKSARVQRVSA